MIRATNRWKSPDRLKFETTATVQWVEDHPMNVAAAVNAQTAQPADRPTPGVQRARGTSHTGEPSGRSGGITHVGRLRHDHLEQGHRVLAIFIHVSPLFWIVGLGPFALLGPPVLWLVGRERSIFVDDHGREAINFMLSFLLLHLILLMTLIGVVLWPVLWVVALVNMIRASVAAGQDEYFRYPITFRFL